MNLIIFGGDFDPIHTGHINMANIASIELDADVIFVPAKVSVWKKKSIDPTNKIQMIQLAIEKYPRFKIDLFEINSKADTTYSIDTIKYLLKKHIKDNLYFLIGADQVNKFHLWKNADEISKLVKIIYFKRPGYNINIDNVKNYNMTLIDGGEIDVSSSSIRDFTNINLDLKVIEYIEKNNLYYIPKIRSYFTNKKRYDHSLSVAKLSYQIALENKIDNPIRAYIAGLLHDIGKDYDGGKTLEIMNLYFSEYKNIGSWAFHQFVGSYIAEHDFNVTDKTILNAIKFHASGYENMDILGKIIYSADKIDPLRGFDSTKLIISMMCNAEEGFIEVLKANQEYLKSHKKDIDNILTYNCFSKYL